MSTPRRPRLVALGDLLLDVVIVPERPIARGTDVPGRVSFRRGGSAANVAAAFVRAGGSASLIASLGAERWAGRLAASLRADGVDVHVAHKVGDSGRLAALVDENGERSFVTQRGAADALRPADLRPRWLRGIDVLHVPAYSLLAEPAAAAASRAAGLAREGGAVVSVDVASAGPVLAFGARRFGARLAELEPAVLFGNRDEAAALVGRPGRRAWTGLLAYAPLVVVKDGAWGCRVLWRDSSDGTAGPGVRQLDVAAQRVTRADSTGAGDAFAAGFLYSLIRSGGPPAALRDRALRAAALNGHGAAFEALRAGRPEVRLA